MMAKFSKGHYIILANALLRAKCTAVADGRTQASENLVLTGLTYAIKEIASALELDNTQFDKGRFIRWIEEDDNPRGRI